MIQELEYTEFSDARWSGAPTTVQAPHCRGSRSCKDLDSL